MIFIIWEGPGSFGSFRDRPALLRADCYGQGGLEERGQLFFHDLPGGVDGAHALAAGAAEALLAALSAGLTDVVLQQNGFAALLALTTDDGLDVKDSTLTAAMRAVLVMAPLTLSWGTLKSTRMRTRWPESESSRMDLKLGMRGSREGLK